MKTATLYASLTMPQRLRTMTSAFGRADQEELDRLVDTSREGSYAIPKVKHHLCKLWHLAALHNSLLLEPCALWLFAQTFSPHELPELNPSETHTIAQCGTQSLAEAASIEAAFTAGITGAGIGAPDWQSFRERLLDHPSKHILQVFLTHAVGHENPDRIAEYREVIEGYLFKADA